MIPAPRIPGKFSPLPLVRLSICTCGFTTLKDEITVGTVYMVDLSSIRGGFAYRCGGCKKIQTDVIVIDAAHRTPNDPTVMPLPWGLFAPLTNGEIGKLPAGAPSEAQEPKP
jgi:hypothetical protein